MESAGVMITSNALSALIGKQILGQAITDAAYSIYTSIGCIFSYDTSISDTIIKLDIKERIKTVDSLIKNINKTNETIEVCLNSLHDIIILIREDLHQINIKINTHKNKYLSSWRYLNCNKELIHLKLHSKLLERRFDYLIKSLSVINYSIERNKRHKLIKCD